MPLFAASIYWVIVALWLAVLGILCVNHARHRSMPGPMRLLVVVLIIDTIRNLAENIYFGVYFGAQVGIVQNSLAGMMSDPHFAAIPNVINIIAACAVIGVLLLKWWPASLGELQRSKESSRRNADALSRETAENRMLFETSADLIFVTDRDRVLQRVSRSCRAILGYTPAEMEGHYAGDFVAPSDFDRVRQTVEDAAKTRRQLENLQINFVHKKGHLVNLAMTGVWSKEVDRIFVIGRDITERRAAEQELTRLAHFDHLTGVLNRASLRRDLEALALEAQKDRPRYTVVSFDLDGFKGINDNLGHSVGDAVLREVARRLESSASGSGKTYRMGGDEFLVVFPDCQDPIEIGRMVDLALKQIELGFDAEGHRVGLGVSAGIAIATPDNADPEDILADADLALYEAKAAGGQVYRLFQPSMRATALARQELDHELRRACINREFVLHYQPQVRLHDGAVVGAEALLRWRHPQRGLLAPSAFIEALATHPSALEVGNWILRTACQTAASWRQKGWPPIRIGVNLFPAQFHDVMLLQEVEEALHQSGLPAEALELEITENIALADDEAMLASLRALREIGVGLAFDDFGTGYGSLSFLTRYPLTRLKIDRSFVQKIDRKCPPTDWAIVRSIISMAHNLGLEVTAEGVEQAIQASLLKNKRCNEAQGYLFSKPLSADDFEAYLQASATARLRPAAGAA